MKPLIEWKYFVPAIALGAAALWIYVNFYDVLIPGLPEGSYRLAVGSLFAIPATILAFGQISISAIFMHHIAAAHGAKARGKFFRSVFAASVMVFLFAFTYVIFPNFGPFYYIVFATGGAPPNALPVEIGWTLVAVAIGTLLYRRVYGMPAGRSLFYTALIYLFITVAAS